jgi:integrase/recombinase XerC
MYGKEGKFRLVPLNQKTQAALDVYLPVRETMLQKHKLETRALFFGLRNNPGKSISVRSIGRMLKRLTKVRKLQPMHPHLLRHACATHLLENRCPLDVIAAILGHDRLDVTAHYAQVSTRFMMDSYNAAHPHARAA